MSLFDIIWKAVQTVWNSIVKIVVAICDFVQVICAYFRDHKRREQLKARNVVAVSVRKHLDDGNYNIVNCLYDEAEAKVVDPEDMEVITADRLDSETMERFGKYDVLVLS